ncbi:MAG: metal-sensing transcriptional repressor [Butyricicoccaceae bacterium]
MMADRKRVEPLLRTARGQLEGVLRMIDENRYCMDIVTQLQAVRVTRARGAAGGTRAHI